MADDDRPDFDLFNLLQGPATMMNGVRGLADNGRKAVSGLLDTIASLQRAAAALELLASRVDRLVTDLEAPLRLLTPELEKAANRVLRVAEIVEGPIDRLLPGLEQAVSTFERLSVNQLPDNLDALRSQVATVIDVFAELPRKLGSLGGFGAVTQLFPGLERLTSAAARLVPGVSTDNSRASAAAPSTPSSASPSTGSRAVRGPVAGKNVVTPKTTVSTKTATPKKALTKKTALKKAASKTTPAASKPTTSKSTTSKSTKSNAAKTATAKPKAAKKRAT